MLKWIVGTVVGVLLGLAGYFSVYLGAFKPVQVLEVQHKGLQILYLEHIGAYHKITPTIEQVETWVRAQGLKCDRSFSQFFDDPRKVEEGRLRAKGGCIWGDDVGVPRLSMDILEKIKPPPGFIFAEIPEGKALKAIFEGSPAIGPSKVYSKAEDYFSEKPLQRGDYVLEVYEIKSQKAMTTTYFFPFQ